jgi:hypothetical protein
MADKFKLKRGDTWRIQHEFLQENGTPVNLTGCTARQSIRKEDDTIITLTITSAAGKITITPLTGIVVSVFSATDTANLDVSRYYTDLEITYSDNSVESTPTYIIDCTQDETV